MMRCVTVTFGFGVVAACICFAQSGAKEPEFEVALVKRATPGPQGVWTNGSPDRGQ